MRRSSYLNLVKRCFVKQSIRSWLKNCLGIGDFVVSCFNCVPSSIEESREYQIGMSYLELVNYLCIISKWVPESISFELCSYQVNVDYIDSNHLLSTTWQLTVDNRVTIDVNYWFLLTKRNVPSFPSVSRDFPILLERVTRRSRNYRVGVTYDE